MIKNIIFDWSGVINDNVLTGLTAINYILKHFGVKEITAEEMKREWIQPYPLFYEKFVPNLTLEKEQELYKIAYPDAKKIVPTRCYPGMESVLKKFKDNGINMIIISSDLPDHLFGEMEDYGLNGIFSDVYSDVVDKRKGLNEILAKHGFTREETIFIGDTHHEIDSGMSVGMITGAVTWGFQNEDDLKKVNPDYIFHNPPELEKIILDE